MSELLYGRNAVRECLRARRRHVHRLLLADNVKPSPIISEIAALSGQQKAPVVRVSRRELDNLADGHQGVALEVGQFLTVDVPDILRHAEKLGEPPFLLMLDHLEDPQNLGAILRTAEIVGIHGAIIPKQRAVKITPAVVNASAGAAEHVLVAEVPNLVQTLQTLKAQNIWVAGLEGAPESTAHHQANLTGGLVIVVGSEGKGLSRLVKETCDFLIKLPMRGKIESLNASVATAVVLYHAWQSRNFEGAKF
jgi:23S rRNA (guanosine2251-2'-O)-methyltransferase